MKNLIRKIVQRNQEIVSYKSIEISYEKISLHVE